MLKLTQVSQTYTRRGSTVAALRPTTLTVEPGEYVAIVGPSGCGKTTLLSILGGMLAPTQGQVMIGTDSLYDLPVSARTRLHHRPSELSVGQQQRVALARTLANDPALILADEPTGNLDPQTREQVLAMFDEIHHEGRTLIMVTHDPAAAKRAQRVLRLVDGAIEQDQPAQNQTEQAGRQVA